MEAENCIRLFLWDQPSFGFNPTPVLLMELRGNCFSVRVVKPWNSLPEAVVSSPSVKVFEARLDEAWKNQPVRFDYNLQRRATALVQRSGYRGWWSCIQYLDDDDDDESLPGKRVHSGV